MKLSITAAEKAPSGAPFVLRESYATAIRKAADLGYEGVEMHIRSPEDVNALEIEQSCAKHGVHISSIGTGLGYGLDGLSLSSPDKDVRKRAVERIESHIELAGRLGSLVIIGLIKGHARDNDSYEAFENHLTDSMSRCLESATKRGVLLVMEAINRFESDNLNTIDSALEFIRRFKSNHLKLHIDTFHINIEENDLSAPLTRAGSDIGHVHFADNNRMYPGAGMFDFRTIVGTLRQIGYGGYIAMECLPLPTPDESAAGAYRHISAMLRS